MRDRASERESARERKIERLTYMHMSCRVNKKCGSGISFPIRIGCNFIPRNFKKAVTG